MPIPEKAAVLLLAHGSPDRVEEVPEFLRQVTGGRPLPDAAIAEVSRHYGLIGHSPLTELTLKQGELLAGELRAAVYVGMRNWKPYIGDAVRAMAANGIEHATVICLAPQNSRTSVGLYRAALEKCAPRFSFDFVEFWHDQPKLIQAFAEKLRTGLTQARQKMGARVPVIFTAHSVPQRTISEGDLYEQQAKATAALVAKAASLAKEDWTFAFQSQGMSGGAWLGPTVEETMRALKAQGAGGVFVHAIGFLCDHVEVLYDIDIAFRQFAEKEGLRLWRAESLNDSPLLTAALAEIVRARLAKMASAR